LTLLQQQAARLSYVEQNQKIAPQMVNNHVQVTTEAAGTTPTKTNEEGNLTVIQDEPR
ncbi:hypothetical protein A2U01_0078999, partial [Trifolium medium]|nr:hypothetical protein [Trifolium medium]